MPSASRLKTPNTNKNGARLPGTCDEGDLSMVEKKSLPSGARAPSAARSLLRKAASYLPNILTLSAVLCGLTSVRLSGEGQYGWAAGAIASAVILDVADGFAARRLGAVSAMGAELDLLADFLNFGVAPAMLLYRRDLYVLSWAGWLVAGFYVAATGIRLARFNILSRAKSEEPKQKWFLGLPSTGAAVAILLSDGAANAALPPERAALALAAATIGLGVLMLSTLHVPSLAVILGRGAGVRGR